jgi:hypothetical protein
MLGVARSLGWKVHMRCANGYRQETRSMRKCVYRKQLDRPEVYLQATLGSHRHFSLVNLLSPRQCFHLAIVS